MYTSVTALNESDEHVKLSSELSDDSRYRNVFTGCLYWEDNDIGEDVETDPDWRSRSMEELVELYGVDGSHFSSNEGKLMDGAYWPCDVLYAEDMEGTRYTVQIFQSAMSEETTWEQMDIPRYVTNLPRKSIRYFNKPYESPQHSTKAFRRHIEIDDLIFPDHWKNLK